MDIASLSTIVSGVAAVAAVLMGVLFITRYLQRGQTPVRFDVERVLGELKHRIENDLKARGAGPSFTEEDKAALMRTMHENIRAETAGALLAAVESRVAEKYGDQQVLTLVTSQATQTLDRLRQELFALSRRGNLNLSIGIVTTITGLALLGAFVLQEVPRSSDMSAFLVGFLPRISLVLLIEIFAYFFLRLYKSTLTEIKYFQNEITSIEAKFLALTVAATGSKEDQLKHVLEHLAKTERNFILDKGQTTVDLERSRLDRQFDQSLIDRLADVVKKRS
jgi:hypothetical protein